MSHAAKKGYDNVLSQNTSLNQTFAKYGVRKYIQSMPFAANSELKNNYIIEFNGDVELLKKELEQKHSNDLVQVQRVKKETILLDPTDHMYTANNDWVWHIDNVNAPDAWDITTGNPAIRIAIIDPDPFDLAHPDLCNKFAENFDPFDNDPHVALQTGDPSHGTAMMGFLAAQTNGCSQYLSIGGFNFEVFAFESDGLGIEKALFASTVLEVDVISISWLSSCNPDPLGNDQLVIQEILDNGTVICAAAGNGNCGGGPIYPFTPVYDQRIICSSSIDENNNHDGIDQEGNSVVHSHYPEVDLCAPGIGTMAAVPWGGSSFAYWGNSNGTSNTAPQVAATVALMKSVNPCLTVDQVQMGVVNSTLPINDANDFPGEVGSGRLNVYGAVLEAIELGTVTNTSSTHSGTQTVTAPTILSAAGRVTSGSDITFQAPQEIELRAGFEVELGAEFEVVMEHTCPF